MGCQHTIADAIVDKECDYLLVMRIKGQNVLITLFDKRLIMNILSTNKFG